MDTIQKFLAYNGKIRIICATTTNLVEEARKLHNLSPVATAALGRTLTMGAILGTTLKEEKDNITIQIKGNGEIHGITVVVDGNLHIKGYVGNPYVTTPNKEDGKLNVGEAVGKEGFLYVIKDLGLKEPYVGMSKLITGEIAEDFANYFYTSEQKGTAVALGVLVDKNGVKSSGGYIIQAMPDATEDELFILEQRIKEAEPISSMLNQNWSLEDIAKDITGDKDLVTLQTSLTPKYACNCSKEKMKKALFAIGKEELKDIIEEGQAEIVCHFCNKKYQFKKEELEEILKQQME